MTVPPPSPESSAPRGTAPWALIVGALAVAGIVIGVVATRSQHHNTQQHDRVITKAVRLPSTTEHVIYELTGEAKWASLTYAVGDTGTQQIQNVHVPLTNQMGTRGFRYTIDPGEFLYFSAQNTDGLQPPYTALRGDESLTCRIVINGRTVVEHTSYGQASIVTCQADG